MTNWLSTTAKLGGGVAALALGGTLVYAAATGGWGSLLVLLALVIALVKQIIAFIGFLTFAIKAVIVFGFIALILGVAVMIFRGWSKNRREKE
ncbi:MAG TPA: hypothetical protein VF599_12040 [Pyrinomonadaceae bacterium]|jgi:hypothetical protein